MKEETVWEEYKGGAYGNHRAVRINTNICTLYLCLNKYIH
jgi:hypothetical protein